MVVSIQLNTLPPFVPKCLPTSPQIDVLHVPNEVERPGLRVVYPFEATLDRLLTQLTKEFKLYFLKNVCPKPSVIMLLKLRQRMEETFSNFVAQFTYEI